MKGRGKRRQEAQKRVHHATFLPGYMVGPSFGPEGRLLSSFDGVSLPKKNL
jgi:hypothetical protein